MIQLMHALHKNAKKIVKNVCLHILLLSKVLVSGGICELVGSLSRIALFPQKCFTQQFSLLGYFA